MKVLSAILLTLVLCAAGTCIIFFRTSGYLYSTHEFGLSMRGKVDIDEINKWLISIDRSKEISVNSVLVIESADWPKSIAGLKPNIVDVEKGAWVRLSWGGGFGHWGLLIGPKGKVPADIGIREYREMIEDGLFAWREFQ